jgi:molybdate transport system regulatory protein
MRPPQIRILFGEATKLGPGKVRIIEAIERTGSISAAARELNMSYRRCWILVDSLNHCFCEPIVTTETGGKRGGGAQVTATGRELLRRYREIEAKAQASVAADLDALVVLIQRREG